MKLKFYKAQLKMKETFSIAYGKYQHRNALLIELSHHEKKGYGECVEIDYYGIRLDDFIVKLKSIEKEIETPSISHPFEFNLKLKSLDLPLFYNRLWIVRIGICTENWKINLLPNSIVYLTPFQPKAPSPFP